MARFLDRPGLVPAARDIWTNSVRSRLLVGEGQTSRRASSTVEGRLVVCDTSGFELAFEMTNKVCRHSYPISVQSRVGDEASLCRGECGVAEAASPSFQGCLHLCCLELFC
jgi:hypothetical protein